MTAQGIPKALATAVEYLQAGEETSATTELERVVQADANNRFAQSLLRQIREDPQTLLGKESFAYRVQAGDSMSLIAQRYLNDLYLFYALARYNGIRVPRQLAEGQVLRIPGKPRAASMPAATAPATPAAAAASPSTPTATAPAAPAPAAPAPPPAASAAPAPATADAPLSPRDKEQAIARHVREARRAMANQNLDAAIRSWDAVLALDPNHRTALLEKQKAVDLKRRLEGGSKP